MLQPALQVLVLVWVKEVPQACVEGAGDHGDHGAPQSQILVPSTLWLVLQSPVLQPVLQLLV